MIACLKKEIVDSAFTNYFKLVTNYQINTRRFATQKGVSLSINWEYPAVEATMTNSLPAFEFTSPVHKFLHLVLQFPKSIKENGNYRH